MNAALKSIGDLGFDIGATIVDVAEKKGTVQLVLDLEKDGADVPALLANVSALQSDVAGLSAPENRTDLEAYCVGKVAGVATGHPGVALLADATVKFAEATIALAQAVKALKQPPAAPAA